ncbi:hypothetical protein [Paratractidigestivibacter sp.]|uniref:hypothetical protein n=1 Tax=Paratractidigestivibacter sp. TaxID=2847316 RepID=UPI002AC937FD|nr:hypothetical protein [Paratractidigestivibacter sp.]
MIDIKAKFEEAKQMELFIMDTQVKISRRPDTYLKLRQAAKDFYGEYPTHGETLTLMDKMTSVAEQMKEIVENWCYEQFAVEAEDFADPFADLIKNVDDCKDQEEVFESLVVWSSVRPFGERAERLNATVLDSYDKNCAEEAMQETIEKAEAVSEYAEEVEAEVNGNDED